MGFFRDEIWAQQWYDEGEGKLGVRGQVIGVRGRRLRVYIEKAKGKIEK